MAVRLNHRIHAAEGNAFRRILVWLSQGEEAAMLQEQDSMGMRELP